MSFRMDVSNPSFFSLGADLSLPFFAFRESRLGRLGPREIKTVHRRFSRENIQRRPTYRTYPVPPQRHSANVKVVLDILYTFVVISPMKLELQPALRLRHSPPSHHPLRVAIQSQINSSIFNNFQHTNLQVLSFDIDTHYPGGWGGMSSLVRSSTPAKRPPAHPLCKSPLYFQQFTNCLFAKSFFLILIRTDPGGGGVACVPSTKAPAIIPRCTFLVAQPFVAVLRTRRRPRPPRTSHAYTFTLVLSHPYTLALAPAPFSNLPHPIDIPWRTNAYNL